MATKIYLRAAAHSPRTPSLFLDRRQARLTAGSALAAENAPTTASGTGEIIDSTTGDIMFISEPLDAVTISGTVTLNVWMSESNMAANVGARIQVRHIDKTLDLASNGLTFLDTSKGIELPVTTRAAQNWTAAPTSQAFAAGDFLAILVIGGNVGTMASGHTFDLGFDAGTGGADGDSWVQFTETIIEQVGNPLPPPRQNVNFAVRRSYSY